MQEAPYGPRVALAIAAALCLSTLPAAAQSPGREHPPGTVPLENVQAPPASITTEPAPKPEVTTRTQGDETVQEYRIRGKLYMMRVTPKHGHPYVLMDNRGDGTFTRQDANTLERGVSVPQWVLMEF